MRHFLYAGMVQLNGQTSRVLPFKALTCNLENSVEKHHAKGAAMDAPAYYRICVQGALESSWSDRLEGMLIQGTLDPRGGMETILSGLVSDQAALSGILNTLYELHLPLRSVEIVEDDRIDHSERSG